ncbi:MAG: dienelactone hydrolase family protein [Proteobacteria bacterium]|nr:dienelactone hydrolase family protein [Pseudomonadota bacterium]
MKSSSISKYILAAVLLLACKSLFAQSALDPEQPGLFPVGVTSMQLDDHGRVDPETGGPRQLLTEIWYPAVDGVRGLPANKFSEFILRGAGTGFLEAAEEGLGGYREGITVAELDRTFENIAVRDASVRDGEWPLILFSHGSGGTRFGYIYFVEHMASHGYIVMAADHTGNARFTFLDGKPVISGGTRAASSATDRPNDISFLLDSMAKMNAGADSRFAGRINLDQVAVSGMSFGGSTSINVLNQDDRVKAGVILAPGGPTQERKNVSTPIMMIIGTEDSVIGLQGNERNRNYFEESQGPHYLVEILDAGHMTFTSVNQYNPMYGRGFGTGVRTSNGEPLTYIAADEAHTITVAYALAFFNTYVRGLDSYSGFLRENHYNDKIIFKR